MLCPTLWVHFRTCPLYRLINWSIYNIKITPILHTIVSYRLSTSNHNFFLPPYWGILYLIVFLHQTTTSFNTTAGFRKLYLIVFLHQTTTRCLRLRLRCYCILSSFYIKPQHWRCGQVGSAIVSYRLSTSNHNRHVHLIKGIVIVSYRLSTSNHNHVS